MKRDSHDRRSVARLSRHQTSVVRLLPDRLSGLPNLKVISRTSAFRYKHRDIDPPKIAKELGVDALVTGRVVQRGNDLSVSAELVDAREDKQLWGRAVQSESNRCFISSTGDCNRDLWEPAGAAVQRRQEPFGEVVRNES
jgi:hypothetical protein